MTIQDLKKKLSQVIKHDELSTPCVVYETPTSMQRGHMYYVILLEASVICTNVLNLQQHVKGQLLI